MLCQINKIACYVASQEDDGIIDNTSNLVTVKNYLPIKFDDQGSAILFCLM